MSIIRPRFFHMLALAVLVLGLSLGMVGRASAAPTRSTTIAEATGANPTTPEAWFSLAGTCGRLDAWLHSALDRETAATNDGNIQGAQDASQDATNIAIALVLFCKR
jgi:hypothetical protein